jgi:chromatin remodeling complex protein RSC6
MSTSTELTTTIDDQAEQHPTDTNERPTDINDPLNIVDDLIIRCQGLKLEMAQWASALKIVRRTVKSGRRRRTTPSDPDRPTGFKAPRNISNPLAEFLHVEPSTQIPRTVVTREIWRYIREHDLKDNNDKRLIDLDKPGGKVLKDLLNPDEPLSLSNLQKFLKVHILPTTSPTSTDVQTTIETPQIEQQAGCFEQPTVEVVPQKVKLSAKVKVAAK